MAGREREPRRWVEEQPDEVAAQMLARASRPSLSPAQLAEVRRRLQPRLAEPPARRRGWWPLALTPVLATAALLLIARRPPPRPQPTPAREWVAAPCAVSSLSAATSRGEQLLLLGPAAAEVDDGVVTLHAGTLLARTEASPVPVRAPGVTALISAHATAEISIQQSGVRVAAYAGRVDAHWLQVDRRMIFEAGRAGSANSDGPASAQRRDQINRWIAEGTDAVVCAAEDPLATAPTATAPLAPVAAQPVGKREPTRRSPSVPVPPPPAPDVPDTPAVAVAPAPAARNPDEELMRQSQLLDEALGRLRAGDGGGALAILDGYRLRFGGGTLTAEVDVARLRALVLLGRRREALALVDGWSLDDWARGAELYVVRGELRAEAGRWPQALGDFYAALEHVDGELYERALWGRSVCRQALGDRAGAAADAQAYLRRFPAGRFAAAAAQLLSESHGP
jgi:hypothetical protein